MNYVIVTSKDDIIKITEKEMKALVNTTGLVYITSLAESLHTSYIYRILPEDKFNQNRGQFIKQGRLHDGTKVIKKFGQWVDANNPDVRLDTWYYPELGKDEVMTEQEYQEKMIDKQLEGESEEGRKMDKFKKVLSSVFFFVW